MAPGIKCETYNSDTLYLLQAQMALNQSRGSENKNGLDEGMSTTAIIQKLACCSSLLETLVSKWPRAEL